MDESEGVPSSDGTTIRWACFGEGPGLVLVHGRLGRIGDYTELCLELSTAVRVVALGRRGYGFSDDGPAYSYQAEADDILAVVRAAGPAAGRWATPQERSARCSPPGQERSTRSSCKSHRCRPVGRVLAMDRWRAAEDAMARGDADDAMTIGLVDGVKLPVEAVASLRTGAQWNDLLPLAAAWIRGFAEIDTLADPLVVS